MSPEKLLNGKKRYPMMKWDEKVPRSELIHSIVMGDVMCNIKQPPVGRMNAPLKMYGKVNALYKAANILDGKCPILREDWDGNDAP